MPDPDRQTDRETDRRTERQTDGWVNIMAIARQFNLQTRHALKMLLNGLYVCYHLFDGLSAYMNSSVS